MLLLWLDLIECILRLCRMNPLGYETSFWPKSIPSILTPKDQKSISPNSAMSNEQLGKRSNNTLQEDLRGQVPTQFAKEWALDGDGLKGKLLDAGWNVAAASHLQRKLNVSSAWRTVPR